MDFHIKKFQKSDTIYFVSEYPTQFVDNTEVKKESYKEKRRDNDSPYLLRGLWSLSTRFKHNVLCCCIVLERYLNVDIRKLDG